MKTKVGMIFMLKIIGYVILLIVLRTMFTYGYENNAMTLFIVFAICISVANSAYNFLEKRFLNKKKMQKR